jgi:hypothetical protein
MSGWHKGSEAVHLDKASGGISVESSNATETTRGNDGAQFDVNPCLYP